MNEDVSKSPVFQTDDSIYHKKIKSVPPHEKDIGIDVEQQFLNDIIYSGESSRLDTARLQQFTQISQSRDTVYQLLDTMAEDPTISAALEIYAEDATEPNSEGRIVWCESDSAEITKFITYLLDTMNIEKNIYKWVYSLCKYGDLYLRLYRESELEDTLAPANWNKEQQNSTLNESLDEDTDSKDELNEAIKMRIHSKKDPYAHYMEMIANPAVMFELTRHGKSCGYIKADVQPQTLKVDQLSQQYYRYRFRQKDVTIYEATDFVHAALEDNTSRTPEEVKIFLDDAETFEEDARCTTYIVRKGQPLLYSAFKVWRCLMLLENSILLNRLTKSSIIRVISVEVGDMAKESVGPHLQGIKSLIEQKSALNVGTSMEEYTNPGPVENNIYVPTRNGQGGISTQQIGGDVDVKSLADLDYFADRLSTALRVPKQFLNQTDDSTGFNGGTALSLISNRYAKMVKRIQNVVIQALTDAINLMLLDKGNDAYINKFVLKMQAPATEEESTRRDHKANDIGLIRDTLDILQDIGTASTKLEITKELLKNVVTDPNIMQLIQTEIDKLIEQESTGEQSVDESNDEQYDDIADVDSDFGLDYNNGSYKDSSYHLNQDEGDQGNEFNDEYDNSYSDDNNDHDQPQQDETILPTPHQLNPDFDFADFTQMR